MQKRECLVCSKTIVPIGDKRKNGKNQKDWIGRRCHKKCYLETKKQIEDEKIEEMFRRLEEAYEISKYQTNYVMIGIKGSKE